MQVSAFQDFGTTKPYSGDPSITLKSQMTIRPVLPCQPFFALNSKCHDRRHWATACFICKLWYVPNVSVYKALNTLHFNRIALTDTTRFHRIKVVNLTLIITESGQISHSLKKDSCQMTSTNSSPLLSITPKRAVTFWTPISTSFDRFWLYIYWFICQRCRHETRQGRIPHHSIFTCNYTLNNCRPTLECFNSLQILKVLLTLSYQLPQHNIMAVKFKRSTMCVCHVNEHLSTREIWVKRFWGCSKRLRWLLSIQPCLFNASQLLEKGTIEF